MTFALQDVPGWHNQVVCVPTSLCAISGLDVDTVVDRLVAAAAARGAVAIRSPSAAFKINDWLRVVRDLGGTWSEIESFDALPYAKRPTISQYTGQPPTPGLRLVFGENADVSLTHVVAFDGRSLVDIYTNGKVVPVTANLVPASYDEFRIKRVFKVARP